MTNVPGCVGTSHMLGDGCIVLAVFQPNLEGLRTQLVSLATQTVMNWRCLIVADGNPGAVEDMVRDAVPGDARFQVVGHQNRVGFYLNFERGLQAVGVDCDWVALCDQDDEWHPRKLEKLIPLLDDATLVSGQAEIRTNGVTVALTNRQDVTLNGLMIDNQITGSFSVFRASLLDIAIPFPPRSPSSLHDHWLGVCAKTIGSIAFLDEPMQAYIQHGSNVIGEQGFESITKRVRRLMTEGPASARIILVEQRLGWRRAMAKTLSARLDSTHALQRTLEMWTTARWRLILSIARAVVTGQAAPARSAGLAFAALMSRRMGES